MATIYVKSVSSYSRSAWDSSTTYSVGNRVSYDDGTLNKVYVCIQAHAISQQPDLSPDYWQEAGSRTYPFHNLDGHLHQTGANTVEFNLFPGATNNFGLEAAGENGTIVLLKENLDPEYQVRAIGGNPGPGAVFNNRIVADKTNTKIILNNWFYVNRSEQIGNTTFENFWLYFKVNTLTNGQSSSTGLSFTFKRCRIDFQSHTGLTNQFMWGYNNVDIFLEECDVLCPDGLRSVFYNAGSSSHSAGAKNCTFYIRNLHPTFDDYVIGTGFQHNNIYYIENSGTTTQTPIKPGAATDIKNNVFYDKSGGLSIPSENGANIDPQFVNLEGLDFRLRPSSPVIGGITNSAADRFQKYSNAIWVDHNHAVIKSSYSYSLDSGDGTNYTFSGDATGADPELTVNTLDTLTFTNNTGGHALAIFNSQDVEVSAESSGVTTFTPKYPDTYYYRCTVSGHEAMRGNIIVSNGTLGSYENPFDSYHDAIDSGYFDSTLTLIFKEGDHAVSYSTNHYTTESGISSAFINGLRFVGESHKARLTAGDEIAGYGGFYVNDTFPNSPQYETPFAIENITIYANNTSGNMNRGLISGCHWKSFDARSVKVNTSTGVMNCSPLDYWASKPSSGYKFKMTDCEINLPLGVNNSAVGAVFINGGSKISYNINSCTFTKLDGYNYYNSTPSPHMVGQHLSQVNGTKIKNCIFYTNVGGEFYGGSGSAPSGIFSDCVIHSTTNSFTKLPQDMELNSTADPLFVSTINGEEDLKLKPNSPAIGGIPKSKYSADTIWVSAESAGTGTGTESNPFHFNGDANSQFLDAVNAAVNNGTFEVVFKDGDYRMTTAGEQLRPPNLGLVTLVAENKDKAVLSAQREVNIGALNSQTLKLKGFKITSTSPEHFIHTQFISNPFHFVLDNCYFLARSFMSMAAGSTINAKNCIFEKKLGANIYIFSGGGQASFTNCLFVDRNLNGTQKFNHSTTQSVFKNCIFRSEQPNNSSIPAIGSLIACAIYNYDASSFSDEEVIFVGDPLMVDFNPTSHESSNYNLRPFSPLIGKGA